MTLKREVSTAPPNSGPGVETHLLSPWDTAKAAAPQALNAVKESRGLDWPPTKLSATVQEPFGTSIQPVFIPSPCLLILPMVFHLFHEALLTDGLESLHGLAVVQSSGTSPHHDHLNIMENCLARSSASSLST